MIDAVELGLQRRGNGFRHVRRAGARPAGADVDDRRRNLRILLNRDQLQRDRADEGHQQRNHHRKARTTDKKREHLLSLFS